MYSRGYKIKKMQLITRIVCTNHKSKLPFAGEFNSSYLTVVLKESICWIAFILFTVKKVHVYGLQCVNSILLLFSFCSCMPQWSWRWRRCSSTCPGSRSSSWRKQWTSCVCVGKLSCLLTCLLFILRRIINPSYLR